MTVPSLESNHGLDTSDFGSGFNDSRGGAPQSPDSASPEAAPMDDAWLLQQIQQARGQAVTFTTTTVRSQWARSYKAYRNEHFDGSKYGSPEFRGRSKLFRPKTRAAVRKAMMTTAKAMFSTGDVVAVSAENESDAYQVASAAIKQELINYRLSRTTRRNGITSWFLTAMGARQDSLITGICASKQCWVYKERKVQSETEDSIDENGMPISGQPAKYKVLIDRPEIESIPPENVLFDPNCDWRSPAQTSDYLIIRYPMTPRKAMQMIENSGAGRTQIPWKPNITEQTFISMVDPVGPSDSQGTRAGRSGGNDPVQQTGGQFAPVWLEETFIKIDGEDWVMWTIDGKTILSDPVLVEDAYPWADGERPIVIGVGAIEAHRPYPTSAVESWQPMQQEINDQVNLRLDHMKQLVTPPAKVMRGRKVDLNQVQRRGPNGIIMLQDMADVEWAEVPDMPQSAYIENNALNADFDDLTGTFNAGTVQTSRTLNETVGGMSLLASDANGMSDFDLSIWVETWAEPVLWQLMKLEAHYESDETVLAIAGEKAQLYEKYGVNHITDQLLLAETTMQVKVGVGASNLPMERIQKFTTAAQTCQAVLAPFVQAGLVHIMPNAEEIINTVFGAAGFQDGGDRFFTVMQGDPSQNPQASQLAAHAQAAQGEQQVKMAQIQAQREKTQTQAQTDQMKIAAQLHDNAADRYAEIYAAHQKSLGEIGRAVMDQAHQAATQGRNHAHAHAIAQASTVQDILKSVLTPPASAAQGQPPGSPMAAPSQDGSPPQMQGFQPLPQINALAGQPEWAGLTSLSKKTIPSGQTSPGVPQ